jgi:hypothetical protein
MRRKNLRKKRINLYNTKNLSINETYEQTINGNDRNYYEIIDQNIYDEINYDQLNAQTNQTVEYAGV